MGGSVGVQAGRVCPGCGKEDSIPLVYGLPGFDLFQQAERGNVALGGCMVPGEEPVLSCRSCGREWGCEGDPTADEQALADLLGVRYADVVRALGTGWRREAADEDLGQWFVSGEPAQVAIGLQGPFFVLARPLTGWTDDRPGPLMDDGPRFTRDDLLHEPYVATLAEDIASARRRAFRWCRTCRRATPPESFVAAENSCERCVSVFSDAATDTTPGRPWTAGRQAMRT